MHGTDTWDDFDTAAALIGGAMAAEDLFGPTAGSRAPARAEFRRLARLCHPDRHGSDRSVIAAATFTKLTTLWRTWEAAADGRAIGAAPCVLLQSNRHRWQVGRLVATSDTAEMFEATDADDPSTQVLVKLPRRPTDSDLLARERRLLTHLATALDDRWAPYVPSLVESFRHRDPDGVERRINVLGRTAGFVTLAAVRQAYPGGVDARDAAWMWRRLLVALGASHRAGVVHGAVLPDHVMIHPGDHGLLLTEWGFGTLGAGEPVGAVAVRYRDWYPPEVFAREPAGPATDIYLASRCMAHLMGDLAPGPMRAFLSGCTLTGPAMRPDDAWVLLAELDELLERLWGPRRFRPFSMPTTPPTPTTPTNS